MDFTTIVGIVLGMTLVLFGIKIQNLPSFWSPESFLIVLGGTISAIIASYPISALKQIPKHFKILFMGNKYNPMQYIDVLVELAQVARKNGLLALEEKATQMEDPFFKQSLMLIVDATNPNKVKEILNNDLDFLSERHEEGVDIYERGASLAPAFGMIGTIIGLVIMLKSMNLEEDGASALSENMAIALITTFYGTLLANLIFLPIAKKLRVRNDEEYLCKQIIIEGVLSIQSGENPNFVKEKLISFLAQHERDKIMNTEDVPKGKKEKKKKEKK